MKKSGARSPSSRTSNGSSGVSSAIENISPQDAIHGSSLQSFIAKAICGNVKDEVQTSDAQHSSQDDGEHEEGYEPDDRMDQDQEGMAEHDQDQDQEEPEDLAIPNSPDPMGQLALEYEASPDTLLDLSVTASQTMASIVSALKTPKNKTPPTPRRKTSGRIKNWCCLKCPNCLADDCGKCINCLDRPKFGGPFIRKQRCLYKKCANKTKLPA
jgi:hypothetical protein